MTMKKISQYIHSHENKISLLFIILFATTVTISLIWINTTEEILGHSYRDIYFYLIQGLRFAGYTIEGYEYVNYLSPLIPFLTSILFRLGFVSETSIFTVTGIFYILGVIGTYLLLKLRFNNIISVFGSLLYGSLSINLLWAANGTIDIPSVSLSIWALYFMILGIEKNQKYFYLGFPIAVLAFFAKYTGGLILAIMILYLLIKPNIINNIKKYIKNIFLGMMVGLLIAIPFLSYFYLNKIPLGFINQAQDIATTTTGIAKDKISNNLFYYFTNLPRFIYNPNHIISWIILLIGIIGLIIGIYKLINKFKKRNGYLAIINQKKISFKAYYSLLILNILVIIVNFLMVGKVSFIISEAIFFMLILSFGFLMNKILNDFSVKTQKKFYYDLIMFSWFFSYMIFFSAHLTKVDRYFTTMAPPFVFFITLSLNFILNIKIKKFGNVNKINRSLFKKVIPISLIAILLISSFGYLTINKQDSLVHDERETVKWLNNYDKNYESKIIWAERGPIFTWYMKKEVNYVNWLSKPSELSKIMQNNNTTYFISIHNIELPDYSKIKDIGEVSIYKQNLK